jgi:putative peptidoglycan lipid II flippase
MVKRFLNLINREIAGLHQAAYLLGFFAICSQVLALFRDRLLAATFGADKTLDLYYAAFRIPDFLFVTVASIVSVSVLIPFLMERFDKGEREGKQFIDDVFTFFFLFMIVVAAVAYVAIPPLMRALFPAYAGPDTFPTLVAMSRILLLSPAFLGFSNLLASVTQMSKRFFIYALSPVVYNIGIILGVLFLYPVFGVKGLAFGVVLGAFFHFAIQIPYLFSQKLFPSFLFPLKLSFIKKIVYTSLPRTITVSSNEIAELFLVSFASFFIPGSIAIFNFSFNLQAVPFSIIGVSYSLAAFPTLTRLFGSGQKDEFLEQMVNSSRHIVFWSVPISVLFIVLRAQIVRVILGSGQFNWNDTRLTAAALALFTLSLLAQNLVALFVRSYYSQGRTKTPLVMNMVSAALIVFGSWYLAYVFQHHELFRNFTEALLKVSDVPGTAVLMLPLGFSIGVIFNLVVHWIGFARHFPKYSRPVLRTLFQSVGASTIMGFIAYRFLGFFGDRFDLNTVAGIFGQGFFSGMIGIASAVIVLSLLNSRELEEVWSTLHKKIWKARVVQPDAELG